MTNQYPPPGQEPDPAQQPHDPFGPPPGTPPPPPGPPPPGSPPASPFAAGSANLPGAGDAPPPPPPGGGGEWMPEWQPTKKKSKAGLIIGIVVVVLLLAGGGAALWFFKPWEGGSASADGGSQSESDSGDNEDDAKSDKGEPSRVAEEAWFAPTWDEVKPYLCTDYAAELEKNGAAEKWQPAGEGEKFEVTDEKISGKSAEVTVKTLVEGNEVKEVPVSLEKEEGDWRICEISDPQ